MHHTKTQYPLTAGHKENSTSKEAADAIDRDQAGPVKNGRIILAMHKRPNSTPDQIARLTRLLDGYVRPRLTALKYFGVVHRVAKSQKTNTGKSAWTQDLNPDYRLLLDQTPKQDRARVSTIIYEEARAEYERELEEAAVALGRKGVSTPE